MEGGHSPREAWKRDPRISRGAGRGAAGGQIPPLPEGSALLAATAADAAAAAASGHGPARRPRPRRTGEGRRGAPSSARGRRAARGHGVRLRAQPGGGEQGTAGPAAGLGRRGLPGDGALLGGGPRPGAPRARRRLPSPRGCTPGARRGGWRRFGVPAGAPTPRRRRRSAVSRTPAPPARCGSDPVLLTGVPPAPRRPIRYPGLLLSGDSEKTPSLASRSPCRSPFTFPLAETGWRGQQGSREGGTNLPCPVRSSPL